MMNRDLSAFIGMLCAVVVGICLFSTMPARADVLDISNGQPNYTSMVKDAALRSEGLGPSGGPWANGNIGNATGFGSNRMYPDVNFPSGRGPRRYVTWFDVSSIPSGKVINSATMSLFFQRSGSGAQAITGYKLSKFLPGKGWAEGVGQEPAIDGSVTWNSQISLSSGSTLWATAGATGATDIDLPTTITFDKAGGGLSEWKDFDVTVWVQDWYANPTHNTGTLLWGGAGPAGPTDNYYAIIGKEVTDGSFANKPKLVIDYGDVAFAPIITEVTPDPDHNAFANVPYVKDLALTQGTSPITWTVLAGTPAGVTVDSAGIVTGWTPTVGNIGTTFTFNIRATNAQGSDDESWQATVHAVTPVIAAVTPNTEKGTAGSPYTKQLNLTQGTTPIVWSVVQGPPGTAVDSTGNVTGWTPTASSATQTFEIKASNEGAYGATYGGSSTVTWKVFMPKINNGFPTEAVFVVRDPNNGGQVREFDKSSSPPGTIINSNFLPDGSNWQSITFSGVGNGGDARMFVARPNSGATDIEIWEINSVSVAVNSTTLGSIIGTTVGSSIAFGNIRYSNVTNTLFVALNPNETTTSTAVCYEFPLSLAANSRIHTYLGETLPNNRVNVAINRRDGTLYMVAQHMGDATATGQGDVLTFNTTAGPFDGSGVNTTFAVLINGQTEVVTNSNYVQPSTVIYRQRPGNDDLLLIPTIQGGGSTVQEFYLNTTLHSVDGNGNLARRTDNTSPLIIGNGWNGQQDIDTGDIWLGARNTQFHVVRSNDATASYEAANRTWYDAAVPPQPLPCAHEPTVDFDGDGDVDMDDFGEFQKCYTGSLTGSPPPLTGYCYCVDSDSDNDIDTIDFNHFVDCATGANVPWTPTGPCPG